MAGTFRSKDDHAVQEAAQGANLTKLARMAMPSMDVPLPFMIMAIVMQPNRR